MTTKKTTKKFQLVSKYANYPTWDEKQNAPKERSKNGKRNACNSKN